MRAAKPALATPTVKFDFAVFEMSKLSPNALRPPDLAVDRILIVSVQKDRLTVVGGPIMVHVPITPVEAEKMRISGRDRAFATALVTIAVASVPLRPVKALALPEFTMIAAPSSDDPPILA